MITYLRDDKRGILLASCFLIVLFSVSAFYIIDSRKKEKEKDITMLSSTYNEDNKELTLNEVTKYNASLDEEGNIVVEAKTDHNGGILLDNSGTPVLQEAEKQSNNNLMPFDTSSVDDEIKNHVEKLLNIFSEKINNKDYEYILSLYNKDYVKDFQLDISRIEERFRFNNEVEPIITNITNDSLKDRVIVTVRFKDSKNEEKIFDFTLYEDGTIADIPIYTDVEINRVYEKDAIKYTISKKITTRLGCIYLLNINNDSEYLLDIQDIYAMKGSTKYGHALLNSHSNYYKIYPGQPVDLILKINNGESFDSINIINKKYTGEEETINILE